MAQQAGHVVDGQLGLQRPGRVGVTKGQYQVGHVTEHHALVRHAVTGIDRLAIHRELYIAHGIQFQSGGRDDDIRRQLITGIQAYTFGSEAIDGISGNIHLPRAQHMEQVTVRHRTDPLVPGVVAGRKVFDIHIRADLALQQVQQIISGLLGFVARHPIEILPQQHILPAGQRMGQGHG